MQPKDLAGLQDQMMQEKLSLRDYPIGILMYVEERDDPWKDLEGLVQAKIKSKDLWKKMVQGT